MAAGQQSSGRNGLVIPITIAVTAILVAAIAGTVVVLIDRNDSSASAPSSTTTDNATEEAKDGPTVSAEQEAAYEREIDEGFKRPGVGVQQYQSYVEFLRGKLPADHPYLAKEDPGVAHTGLALCGMLDEGISADVLMAMESQTNPGADPAIVLSAATTFLCPEHDFEGSLTH